MDEHELALARRELADVVGGGVPEAARRRPREVALLEPVLGLRGERPEAVGALPEPRQELDQDTEPVHGPVRLGEEGTGLAALEQERVPLVVAGEQAHGAVAVPALERVGLLLGLAMRPEDLEDGRRPVPLFRADDVAGGAGDVRLAERQPPLGRDLRGQGRRPELPLLDRSGRVGHPATLWPVLGVWRSLVARSVRVGEVPSSNLGTPII